MTLCEKLALEDAELLPKKLRKEFDAMVAGGAKPQFALMCVQNSPPKGKGNLTPKFHNVGGSVNDQSFVRSAFQRMRQMNPMNQKKILDIARKAGINTNGKAYCGQLGRYDNPLAWCSTGEDVLESCKRQNLSCDGAVTYKAAVDETPTQGKELADDIVAREANKLVSRDPKLAEQVRKGKVHKQEVRERVIAKHGRKRLTFNGS